MIYSNKTSVNVVSFSKYLDVLYLPSYLKEALHGSLWHVKMASSSALVLWAVIK